MTNLIGVYECKVDEKGRLMLPAALRKQLMSVINEGFIIKYSLFHKCLELYPVPEFDKESSEINRLNRFVKKNVDFIRSFMVGVQEVKLDSAGRLQIPRDHIVYSGITRSVVLSSSVNRIEIWDKDKYDKLINEVAAGFADLAEEVMGNQKQKTSAPDDIP